MSQELQITKETLPVLAFNFDALKTWATGLTERYTNLVVTEDAVTAVKKDMADLNKAKKAVDDARKEAVRRVSEPIREFESQIKEVCGIFDTAYARLGAQVKIFEDAQREEKRETVMQIIEEEIQAAYPDAKILPHIPVQERWLLKTTSLKTVRQEVEAIIARDIEEDKRRRALEQARQDRAAAIESHVKARNQRDGYDVSVSLFMGESFLDVAVPLTSVMDHIDNYFTLETQKRERQAAKNAAPAMPSASPGAAVKSSPQPQNAGQSSAEPLGEAGAPAQTRAASIVFSYDVANEAAVNRCLETLKDMCVNFAVRTR
jgi:hypothetical protein